MRGLLAVVFAGNALAQYGQTQGGTGQTQNINGQSQDINTQQSDAKRSAWKTQKVVYCDSTIQPMQRCKDLTPCSSKYLDCSKGPTRCVCEVTNSDAQGQDQQSVSNFNKGNFQDINHGLQGVGVGQGGQVGIGQGFSQWPQANFQQISDQRQQGQGLGQQGLLNQQGQGNFLPQQQGQLPQQQQGLQGNVLPQLGGQGNFLPQGQGQSQQGQGSFLQQGQRPQGQDQGTLQGQNGQQKGSFQSGVAQGNFPQQGQGLGGQGIQKGSFQSGVDQGIFQGGLQQGPGLGGQGIQKGSFQSGVDQGSFSQGGLQQSGLSGLQGGLNGLQQGGAQGVQRGQGFQGGVQQGGVQQGGVQHGGLQQGQQGGIQGIQQGQGFQGLGVQSLSDSARALWHGAGLYCAAQTELYYCNERTECVLQESCKNGCVTAAPGVPDFCAVSDSSANSRGAFQIPNGPNLQFPNVNQAPFQQGQRGQQQGVQGRVVGQ